jgi:hypothetical protein
VFKAFIIFFIKDTKMKTKNVLFILLVTTSLTVYSQQSDRVEQAAIVQVPVVSAPAPIDVPAPAISSSKPLVQIGILLDTSNSMDGLIAQAKTELWAIVNEFIFAKRNGMEPEVQVALYEYGKSSLDRNSGFIRQVVPFTTDLDKISEELFALKTNGGDEYCGWVIQDAAKQLKWSDSLNDLKVIFIAGNEPFTQGPVDYNKSCKEAIAKGIIVNTIHCGSESEGINGHWKDGAVLADGGFISIDQNRQVVRINAPQDKEIAELNTKLNDTYIAYGRGGIAGLQRQIAQDENASSISQTTSSARTSAKASFNYKNSSWDLVDALQEQKVDIKTIKEEDLPENMQNMTSEERQAYADTKATERQNIQKRVQELNTQRENYVKSEMQKQASGQNTLGSAITQTVRQQAIKKNFSFEQPKVAQVNEPNTAVSN